MNQNQRPPRSRQRNLPQPRSNSSTIIIWGFSLFLFLFSAYVAKNDNRLGTLLPNLCFSYTLLFLTEFLLRLLRFPEEYKHLETKYNNSKLTLIKDLLSFRSTFYTAFLVLVCVAYYQGYTHHLWWSFGPNFMLLSISSLFFAKVAMKLESGPVYDSLWIENSNGLDYGSGMAHSFFHGYLKLVIPKTGTSEKHLEELMKDYEDKHHVALEFYKLFILIPKSLYCPTSIMDEIVSPSIEESSSLDEKKITVAGVLNRIYKNSVYKIVGDKGKRIYVAAEYATPLKTFKDVVNYNGEFSNFYKKHKNDIVLQFYLTLQKVLNEYEECRDYCELVFYDDMDVTGKYKDVGQVLLKRIRKLRKGSVNRRTP